MEKPMVVSKDDNNYSDDIDNWCDCSGCDRDSCDGCDDLEMIDNMKRYNSKI